MNERERIELLSNVFGPGPEGVRIGIGDDAAVIEPVDEELVWTVDAQVEGTHFERAWLSSEDVGFRSFMAAASDLAAMGARPVGALSSLVLPDDVDDAAFRHLAEGQALAARTLGAQVVGGNLARGRELSVTTTLLGRTSRPLLRSGAVPGDHLYAAGRLGLSGAGLLALLQGKYMHDACKVAVSTWRRPVACVAQGRVASEGALAGIVHAAIDVSDGLATDVGHIAEASGVAVVLEAASVLALGGEELARAASEVGAAAIDLCLDGGEDYALIVASSAPLAGFRKIGRITPYEEGSPSRIYLEDARGCRAIEPRGFDHFARR